MEAKPPVPDLRRLPTKPAAVPPVPEQVVSDLSQLPPVPEQVVSDLRQLPPVPEQAPPVPEQAPPASKAVPLNRKQVLPGVEASQVLP